jgi:uncharacterized cupredoxin-like copper-binding protein
MRKFPAVLAASAVAFLAGCGDSDDGSEGQSATTTAASGGATTTAAAGAVPVTLADRTVQASNTIKSGSVTFAVKNSSSNNQHELVVMKGKFADLPKTGTGGVDESQLAAGVLVARTEKLSGGASANLTVNLAAGPYVLLCNITNGPTSHAAQGQVLDVTVS